MMINILGPMGSIVDDIRRGRFEHAAKVGHAHQVGREAYALCVVQAVTGEKVIGPAHMAECEQMYRWGERAYD